MDLILPWPPSMNTYWRQFQGRMLISKAGREYRKAVMNQIVGSYRFTGQIRVVIEAWRPDRRRRDLDNLLKAPLDALTHAGVWDDDELIVDLRIYWAPDMGGMLKIRVEDA